jgi:hypothetical protein
MKRPKLWQILVGLGVIALALLTLVLVSVLRSPPSEESRPLPNPNGYDDILKATAQVTPIDVPGRAIDELTLEELQAAVESNQAALRLARAALGRECRVPVEYSQAYLTSHMPELGGVKRLAQAFRAEGRLAEKENRAGEAARSYLDAIRLGHAVAQGGFMIDRLVGIAMEAIGMMPLQRLADRLDVKNCREFVVALEKVESGRESWETVLRRERVFARRTAGWRYVVFAPVLKRMLRPAEDTGYRRLQSRDAHLRLLMLELAIRCQQLEKGSPPQSLGELVPSQLKAVPLDPFSNKPFIYRLEGTGFKLYSVGPDGKDDGGVSIVKSSAEVPQGDVLLNSPY